MRMRLVLLSAFAVGLGLAAAVLAEGPGAIDPAQAAKHVGKKVTVEGVVVQVSDLEGEPIFLNFGGRYPDHVFAAVVLTVNRRWFPHPAEWEGKRVRVSGTVQLYRGKPEIVLSDPKQLVEIKQQLP
jgi:DNA/RNA endonuclease YhcR with UshA esterase domain